MPKQYLFDISQVDLSAVLFDQEGIRQVNPQRGAMEHLNAIIWADPSIGAIVGYKDVRADEFWVPGHLPDRPLLPGVIMIEAAAQLSSFYTKQYLGWTGFVGFGGVSEVKFRQQIVPGQRLHLLAQKDWVRHGRVQSHVQGLLDGTIAFEAVIVGVQF